MLDLRKPHLHVIAIFVLLLLLFAPLDYELYITLNTLIGLFLLYCSRWEYKIANDLGIYSVIALILAMAILPSWDEDITLELWHGLAIIFLVKHRFTQIKILKSDQ